jgi:DNA segregation ATPase FtsK/SpoIIIE-like protein
MGKKSPAPPPAPDYAALSKLNAEEQAKLIDKQTAANRPNQTTPWGTTSWTQDANGKWTENIALNPADQAQLDAQRNIQSNFDRTATGLLGQVEDNLSNPLDFGSLPDMTGYDFDSLAEVDPRSVQNGLGPQGSVDWSGLTKLDPGFGAVQEVQDAMMSRLRPGRDQQRERELQRLRNQGLSDNTEAYQRALKRLDEGDTDAENQALLGATTAYGDIFNRGLSANTQEMAKQFGTADLANQNRDTQFNQNSQVQQMLAALRGQQFGEQGAAAALSGTQRQQQLMEQDMRRQQPLNDLLKLQGEDVSMPTMPSFMQAGTSQAPDYMGAGVNQYQAALDQYNAKQSRKGGLMNGLFGLAGSALGGPAGGVASSLFSKMFGG